MSKKTIAVFAGGTPGREVRHYVDYAEVKDKEFVVYFNIAWAKTAKKANAIALEEAKKRGVSEVFLANGMNGKVEAEEMEVK